MKLKAKCHQQWHIQRLCSSDFQSVFMFYVRKWCISIVVNSQTCNDFCSVHFNFALRVVFFRIYKLSKFHHQNFIKVPLLLECSMLNVQTLKKLSVPIFYLIDEQWKAFPYNYMASFQAYDIIKNIKIISCYSVFTAVLLSIA